MNEENIILYSNKFELSESENEPDCLIGKWIICDFDLNKNDVKLDRETINDWLSTLVGKPLVGKVVLSKDGVKDFSSHNVKIVVKTDDFGQEYEDCVFDTSAFGSFVEVGIEEIDGVEHIVATTKIWKRFEEACDVIKSRYNDGTLATSWEIQVLKQRIANYLGKPIRIIEKGSFIGHCALGENIEPAYDSSRLLDVASKNIDIDLERALINDIYKLSQKEEKILSVKKNESAEVANGFAETDATTENTIVEEIVNSTPSDETQTEAEVTEPSVDAETSDVVESALTVWDLRNKIEAAYKEKTGKWCYISWWMPEDRICWAKDYSDEKSELDYKVFDYSVDGDIVAIGEIKDAKLTVSFSEINTTVEQLRKDVLTKDTTISELNAMISELTAKITDLIPFKSEFEKLEAERIQAETNAKKQTLKNSIVNTNVMTIEEIDASKEVSAWISNLDETAINKFIVSKISSSVNAEKSKNKTEVASTMPVEIKTNIVDVSGNSADDDEATCEDFIKAFLGKK